MRRKKVLTVHLIYKAFDQEFIKKRTAQHRPPNFRNGDECFQDKKDGRPCWAINDNQLGIITVQNTQIILRF